MKAVKKPGKNAGQKNPEKGKNIVVQFDSAYLGNEEHPAQPQSTNNLLNQTRAHRTARGDTPGQRPQLLHGFSQRDGPTTSPP
jgi:hypothetical protein